MSPVLAEIDTNQNEQVIPSTKNRLRKTIVTESDDDDEDSGLQLDISSEEDDDDSSDDENRKSITLDEAMGRKPPVKSTIDGPAAKRKKAAPPRRRRRSSARFLRLSGRFDTQDYDEEEEDNNRDNEQLGEMYKRAIRLNAENRINAGNSWGLNLIDNIDKFLTEDKDDEMATESSVQANSTSEEDEKRVNFTKASCTLDASVKIYSYRVDDVHLTSYKVLANLNRTESGKKDKSKDEIMQNEATPDEPASPSQKKHHSRRVADITETLESNMTNINMNKLDSAFDIDPLFHKMSKTFDEGGAKGLLLVNLGVGDTGCNIVFDSKQESLVDTANPTENEVVSDECPLERMNRLEGIIDISSLSSKLESLLSGSSIDSVPLVPQLESLRDDYSQLKAEGFVDDKSPKSKSRRYATSNEEEKEAEQSIHQEAIERSRISLGVSVAASEPDNDENDDQFAADDYGGDDDDDDDDDMAFSDFIGADENGGRYSSISFRNENPYEDVTPGLQNTHASTTVLLDAMMSGDVFSQGGEYEYFSQASLEKITGGNLWAGSAHWKKSENIRQKKDNKRTDQKKSRSKKSTKERKFLDLRASPSCLKEALKHPKKSKRGGDPIQFSKATKTKHTKNDNLLPPDAEVGLSELSKLFLRPNAFVKKAEESGSKQEKTVGFLGLEPFGSVGFDDGDDGSFGDDDGPGFDFVDPSDGTYAEGDDGVVSELEGVRKVHKVRVGYATIAKKVDVKRLKKDLWSEIETTVMPREENNIEHTSDLEREAKRPEREDKPEASSTKHISFKETVEDMNASQAQTDVTLPFYFICLLHLANEKGLRLESHGLQDFIISHDDGAAPSFGTLPTDSTSGSSTTTIANQRGKRVKESAVYQGMADTDEESVGSDA